MTDCRKASRPLFDWDLGIALATYAAASASDYLLTVAGLLGQEVREVNPFLAAYIGHLGPVWGLLVPKIILGFTAVVTASLYLHTMHRRRRTRVRAQYILYPGALITALTPVSWVVCKAWPSLAGPW